MVSFWDLAYVLGAPWDTRQPPVELTDLVERGRLQPCKVLDIGCGTGTTVVYLAGRGFEASGLDISRMAIKKANGKALRHGVNCRLYRLDFTNSDTLRSAGLSNFDLLVDVGCFHSLSSTDRDRYADSVLRVSHVGTLYLLWAFLRGSGSDFGPPGVDRGEVESRFLEKFQINEQREIETSFRTMLFFQMKRLD